MLEPYQPVATFLGTGEAIAALPTPLFGLSIDEVKKAYPTTITVPGDLPKSSILFPDTEWGSTAVGLFLDDAGKVVSFNVDLPYTPDSKASLSALFEAKWGKPTPDPDAIVPTNVYRAKSPTITVMDSSGMFGDTFGLSESDFH